MPIRSHQDLRAVVVVDVNVNVEHVHNSTRMQ